MEKRECVLHTDDAYNIIELIQKAELEDLIFDKFKEINDLRIAKTNAYIELRKQLINNEMPETSDNINKLLAEDKDLKNRIEKAEKSSNAEVELIKIITKGLLKKIVVLKKDINSFVAKAYAIKVKEVEDAELGEFINMLMGVFNSESFKNVISIVKVFFK